ncbi:zinc ribbon domain-containing protein [Herbiconiux sp.]|uniref:zinc ribbon domain-containing protein n=1 Tax=Herbiconiux sp. TaxID=1871186 RepID=UPI0025B92032|nr:zinc ribbon domain-containing protein [Herbiconiux sp.]
MSGTSRAEAAASGALPAFLQSCLACATVVFPPRLACRSCGDDRFEPVPAGPGVVEQVTELPGGLRIASVRARGVLVVCSSTGALAEGDSVTVIGSPGDPAAVPAQVYLPGSAHIHNSAHTENEGTP